MIWNVELKKIINSTSQDQKILIMDFAYGIDTKNLIKS